MKLHLQSTDYRDLLSSAEDLTVSLVDNMLRTNLVTEFNYLRSNALPPLSTFLDYITYGKKKQRSKVTMHDELLLSRAALDDLALYITDTVT